MDDNTLGTEWYWLPVIDGLKALLDEVDRMRSVNWDSLKEDLENAPQGDPKYRFETRSPDGVLNNPDRPRMGSSNTLFARNFPMDEITPEEDNAILNSPNPRKVSRLLMTRGGESKKASSINLLAGAWIQFQVHDWFNHERVASPLLEVEIADEDMAWPAEFGRPMKVQRTRPAINDPTAYVNKEVHWWDASQIYGSSEDTLLKLRKGEDEKLLADGKLALDEKGYLFYDADNETDFTGFTENWWLGLRILHTLFTREHNNICDMLRKKHQDWTDEAIFNKARLINAALMAKIHTVEWTPALLNHPTVTLGMKSDWCGMEPEEFRDLADLLMNRLGPDGLKELVNKYDVDLTAIAGQPPGEVVKAILGTLVQRFNLMEWAGVESLQELLGILSQGQPGLRKLMRMLIEGNPKRMYGTKTAFINQGEVDGGSLPEYAMTEEFASVYRMHPLIPDTLSLRHLANDMAVQNKESWNISEAVFKNARGITDVMTMADVFYSFGKEPAGALTLNNFPAFLQQFDSRSLQPTDDDSIPSYPVDLAAVDLIRDRERGVPRYNKFRELLYGEDRPFRRFCTFEQMTGGDSELAKKLREAYGTQKVMKDGVEMEEDNVDDVDLMVGLFVEPRPPGFGFSETTFMIFSLMTPFRLKSDRWFTEDYTPDKYTPEGMEWIENNTMRSVLARNFPELKELLRYVKNPFKPWPTVSSA